jgi:hypothetical protein
MLDGTILEREWETDEVSTVLPVNSPFGGPPRTVTVRAAGNLKTDIADISVDLTYTDTANDYTQTKSVVLSDTKAFETWAIPVISPTGGTLTYSGSIRRVSGAIEEIPLTTAETNIIDVGDKFEEPFLVTVDSQLLDWNLVNVVSVQLSYADPANQFSDATDFLLKQAVPTGTWTIELKDKDKTTYTWAATYYMKDGSQRAGGPAESNVANFLLPPPPSA